MKLHFSAYGGGDKTLIILHGLLGSERNWYSVAKKLSVHFRLLIPDQRNHGVSPHDDDHSILSMRRDLEEFIADHKVDRFYLLGHSMGGHVAMNYAFAHPEDVRALIVEDIAPRSYDTGLIEILRAMNHVDLSKFTEKKQVEAALAPEIKSQAVRSFVITNLVREKDHLFWRVNLPALMKFTAEEITRFRSYETDHYNGPTLFIGGEKSYYKLSNDAEVIKRHFPHAEIKMIENAGHWIHHEAVDEFCDVILNFLNSVK